MSKIIVDHARYRKRVIEEANSFTLGNKQDCLELDEFHSLLDTSKTNLNMDQTTTTLGVI